MGTGARDSQGRADEGVRDSATRRATGDPGVADTVDASDPGEWVGRPLPEGTLLEGAYRVGERIGRGGMGAVYRAEHVTLGRQFAVKVVGAEARIQPAYVKRLVQEARTASSIEHENIIDVTHLGTDPETGLVFVVMELLRGEDLRGRMLRRREEGSDPWLPDDEVRRIAPQILGALAAAHAAGIVHRDLKPENVFLATRTDRQVVKVLDFGMSKVAVDDEGVRLTKTGQIIGTPLYMAPEQSRDGALVDARADVYSLGVMLYELLAGDVPFPSETVYHCILAHATMEPPPLEERRPDLPAAVVALIHRCLEKDPERRPADGAELLSAWKAAWTADAPLAIEPVAPSATETVPTEVVAPAKAPAWGWIVAAAALVVGLGGWAWSASRTPEAAPVADPPTAAVEAPAAPAVEPEARTEAPAAEAPTEPPAEPTPPATRRVTVSSSPPGAAVREGDQPLGTTPLEVEITEGAPARRLTLALRGRRDATVDLDEESPDRVEVTLRPSAPRENRADDLAGW